MTEEKKQELNEAVEKINNLAKEEDEYNCSLIIVGFKEETLTSVYSKGAERFMTALCNALAQNAKLMAILKMAIVVTEEFMYKEKQKE